MNGLIRICALAALSTPFFQAGAVGNASASASLGPLTVQVIDLDPNDGIAAGISFLSLESGSVATIGLFEGYNNQGPSSHQDQRSTSQWQDVSLSAAFPLTHASASLSGASTSGNGAAFRAEGATAHSGIDGYGSEFYARVDNSRDYATLRLQPHTKVVITALASLHSEAETTVASAAYDNVAIARSAAVLNFSRQLSTINQVESRLVCETGEASANCSLSQDQLLTLTFENASGVNQYGEFFAYALAWGDLVAATPASVPEPSAAALLALGMAALALRRTRRRNA